MLLLVEWGLVPVPLLYLSAFFHRRRSDYYELLMAVSERGRWRDWLQFFLLGITEQARDALLRAKQLQDLQTMWKERLTRPRGSTLPLRLADSLFDSPVLSVPEAQRRLNVTYPGAWNIVQKLVSAGILQQSGESSYGRMFVAGEILEVISET